MQLQLNKVETNIKSQLGSRDLFPVVTYKIYFFAFIAGVLVENEEPAAPPEAGNADEVRVTLTQCSLYNWISKNKVGF